MEQKETTSEACGKNRSTFEHITFQQKHYRIKKF